LEKQKYYFIAIGGVGMSGLAKYLLQCGFEVSGSDIVDSKYITELRELGATVYIGHSASHVPESCKVIASSAIRETNVEIVRAKELGLPIYHRSDLLAEISRMGKFFIGYAGTHGKTTTSGLTSYVLEMAGLKPSYVVGGIIPKLHTNAECTDGKFLIAELDESDGTIVKYSPNISVINNLEADHLDFYKEGLKSILDTFNTFLSGLKPDSKVLACIDSVGVEKLVENHKQAITYSLTKDADYVAKNIDFQPEYTTFDVYHKGQFLVDLKIILRGRHNVNNALAVIAALNEAGVDVNVVKPYFSTFSGMGRRFQMVGEFNGISLYDDYAHHPTEIKATLSSTAGMTDKRVIAVFQPHRYTRLKNLYNEFMTAFGGVDKLVVTDVFAASEDPIEGVNSEQFAKDLKTKYPDIDCEYIQGTMCNVAEKLYPQLKANDVVIGLGAGTITELGSELLKLSKKVAEVGR
jgi:UDP-N-acetylmuramate--alanine ligase